MSANKGDTLQSVFPSNQGIGADTAGAETATGVGDDVLSTEGGKVSEGKTAASAPEVQIMPKTRFLVFGAIFYILLVSYLFIVLFFPQSSIARFSAVFETFWAQFVFLVLCLVGITLSLFGLFCFVCEEYLKSRWYQPKLGKLSVSEGFISKEQLKEVLEEQEQKIGEVLVRSGRITEEQLTKALALQKKSPGRLGEILNSMGYVKEEDVYWALGKMQRKIGEIFIDKGMLTKEDVLWLIEQQKSGARRI